MFIRNSGNVPCQFLIKCEGYVILGIGVGFKIKGYELFFWDSVLFEFIFDQIQQNGFFQSSKAC